MAIDFEPPDPYGKAGQDRLRRLAAAKPGQQPDEILPHEQDDPELAKANLFQTGGFASNAGQYPASTASVISTLQTFGTTTRPTSIRTIIEGPSPEVSFDNGIVLTMNGGREVVFGSTNGMPVYVDGNERRFRLTKEEAQELTRKLARMLAEHSDD